MNPAERALFEKLGELKGEKRQPADWARLAWPTAFVCKRTQKPKAEQSVRNAELKAKTTLELFAKKGLIQGAWVWIDQRACSRMVYWRD